MVLKYVPIDFLFKELRDRPNRKRLKRSDLEGTTKYPKALFNLKHLNRIWKTSKETIEHFKRVLPLRLKEKHWRKVVEKHPYVKTFVEHLLDTDPDLNIPLSQLQRKLRSSSESDSNSSENNIRSSSKSKSRSRSRSRSRSHSKNQSRSESRSKSRSRSRSASIGRRRRLQYRTAIIPKKIKKLKRYETGIYLHPKNTKDRNKNLPGTICRGIRQVCRYKNPTTKRYSQFIDDGTENDRYLMRINY